MEEQRRYGLENEAKIINYLNQKKFNELNEKWKKHILKIFQDVSENDLIIASHYPDKSAKPDMILRINEEEKYVSIKTGHCPSVHQEPFSAFQRFLKKIHVSSRTRFIIRFFHYGESKKLGRKENPLTLNEMKERFSEYFLEASEELDDEQIIKQVIDRTIIRGTNYGRTPIDFLYYGDLEHGSLISKKEIYQMVLAYRDHKTTPIHFGALGYYPNSRNPERRERNFVRIKWPMLSFLYYTTDEDIEKLKMGTFKHL